MYSKSIAYAQWKCQYHIVFIPKYRRKIHIKEQEEDAQREETGK